MSALLAYCPTCTQPFQATGILGIDGPGSANVRLEGCTVGCPKGHKGILLDGDFELFQNSTRLVSGPPLTREVFEHVIKLLKETKEDGTAAEFAKKASEIDPRLGAALAGLTSIKKGWHATAMAAVLTLAHNCHCELKVDVNELIDQMRGGTGSPTHAPAPDHKLANSQSLPHVIKTILHR